MLRKSVFLCLVSLALFAKEEAPPLLSETDVSKIMNEIFEQHVDQKQMNLNLLKSAFRIYIEQFDPDKIYLLETEVHPFLDPSNKLLQLSYDGYQKGDYSAFATLNDIFQTAIMRNRSIRSEIFKQGKDLLNEVPSSDNSDHGFAKNEEELKAFIKNEILTLLSNEQDHYGAARVEKNLGKVLALFNQKLMKRENGYLFEDEKGRPLDPLYKENIFVIHLLKALTGSLDAHTAFLDPQEAYNLKTKLEKEFAGIGVVLKPDSTGLVVVSEVVAGGPAEKSGQVKVSDKIEKINGELVTTKSFDDVLSLLKGKDGESVDLLLKRSEKQEGQAVEKQYQVTLKRAPITVDQDRVEVSSASYGNGIIGTIKLHSFYQGENGVTSENDIKQAIKKLNTNGNLRALILDLRDNSGGFLNQAIKVAGLFITNGVIVISKYSNGDEKFYRDMDGKTSYDGPLIVLTSKATASAAEIVAEALQDYGVALVVGDPHTYGKGTIQSQTVTDNKGVSYFKVTVGKYYTVSGKTPQISGVAADIVVPGPFSDLKIGEVYLEGAIAQDKISSAYKDTLADVEPGYKPWYEHYYVPTIQEPISIWKSMTQALGKKSQERIRNNTAYLAYLKKIDEVSNGKFSKTAHVTAKTGDEDAFDPEKDYQLEEAINIAKDMVELHDEASH